MNSTIGVAVAPKLVTHLAPSTVSMVAGKISTTRLVSQGSDDRLGGLHDKCALSHGAGGQKSEIKVSAEQTVLPPRARGRPSLASPCFSWLLVSRPLATRLQPLPPSHMPSSLRLPVVVSPLSPLARIPITGFKANP